MMEQVELIEKLLLQELKLMLVVELLGKQLKHQTLQHQLVKVFFVILLVQHLH